MKLSIILPAFNVENYIKESVDSIFKQGLDPTTFEVIIVNDGSEDGTLDQCHLIEKQYSNVYIVSQENKGQSVARNVGISLANGTYVYFLDSDDYLKPFYLERLLEIMESNELDFIGFGYELTNKRFDGITGTEALKLNCEGTGIQLLEQYNYNNGPWWYIFKKNILDGLVFEEDRLCEDGLFTTQLIQKVKKGQVLNNKIYCYYENPTSTVKTVNHKRKEKINKDMFYAANRFKYIIDLLPNKNENDKAFLRLKDRQESYTFFALVRFLKSKESFRKVRPILGELTQGQYPAYPILQFNGYNSLKNRILIHIFNHKWAFKFLIKTNQFLSIIK